MDNTKTPNTTPINYNQHSLKKCYFPVYTLPSENPIVVAEQLPAQVFDPPFFNDAVPMFRAQKSISKRFDFNSILSLTNEVSLPLKGFIFHTSHCGSTLLANMLGASQKTRIISETEAINGLLLSAIFYEMDRILLAQHLNAIITAYLQPLGEAEQVLFKLSSWNIFFIDLYQEAFPNVPWIFIDRNTEEVVQSLIKTGGGFAAWYYHPTTLLRDYFLGGNIKEDSIEKYLSAMVEAHKKYAENAHFGQKIVATYPSFLDNVENRILPHFNLKYSKTELAAMEEIKKYNAKSYTKVLFVPMQPKIPECSRP